MPIELWVAFAAACAVVLVIPGPTILTVISYSMTHGARANVALVAAVALGDSTALVFSLLGLGALLAASAFWFTVIKWIGGLYLLYLGMKMLRTGLVNNASFGALPGATDASVHLTTPPAPDTLWKLFANTYVVTALNPKGMVFFVAFLPQFISAGAPVAQQLWILAVTFVVMATINAALYAVFAATARKALTTVRAQRRFNLAGGSLLAGAGVWALLAKRPG
jgi:threonine/homoserine/homoserine lactone efflux protein